jgi:hypothetical protein
VDEVGRPAVAALREGARPADGAVASQITAAMLPGADFNGGGAVILMAKQQGQPTEMARAELATELLLGKPCGDDDGRYSWREYPKGRRALAARAALAELLRAEAPDGYFVHLLAELISPRAARASAATEALAGAGDASIVAVVKRQRIEFVPPPDGKRSAGRLEFQIVGFLREQLARNAKKRDREQEPALKVGRLDGQTVRNAVKRFRVSEKTIRNAWGFDQGRRKRPRNP